MSWANGGCRSYLSTSTSTTTRKLCQEVNRTMTLSSRSGPSWQKFLITAVNATTQAKTSPSTKLWSSSMVACHSSSLSQVCTIIIVNFIIHIYQRRKKGGKEWEHGKERNEKIILVHAYLVHELAYRFCGKVWDCVCVSSKVRFVCVQVVSSKVQVCWLENWSFWEHSHSSFQWLLFSAKYMLLNLAICCRKTKSLRYQGMVCCGSQDRLPAQLWHLPRMSGRRNATWSGPPCGDEDGSSLPWLWTSSFFLTIFFSSVKLAQDLQARSTLMCSKIRLNRKGWPKELSASVSKKMKCGEVKFCQDENMVATLWKHKRPVAILSTNAEPKMGETEGRAPGGKKVAVPVPVLAYNRSMGGVDLFDQYASYYPVGRPSLKWWWYLCWWLFQVAMVNSFLLWKQNQPTSSSKRGQRRIDFHLAVMKSLLEGTVSRPRAAPQALSQAGVSASQPLTHTMERLPGNKKACYMCQTVKTRTDKGHTKKNVYGCAVCKPHFCKGQCFTVFHQELAQKVQTQ